MIDRHFYAACRSATEAPKPGHVAVDDDGREIGVAEFLRAAAAAAPEIARQGAGLGERVLHAVRATQAAMGRSIGAHIAMICAPLAMAGERKGPLPRNVHAVLAEATASDVEQMFEAMTLVSSATFADVFGDVDPAMRGSLTRAIRAAAEHDSVARLYAEAFSSLFRRVLPPFLRTLQRRQSKPWAAVECYLRWLALWPDSEIVHRYGAQAGTAVQTKARGLLDSMERSRTLDAMVPLLRDWDAELKMLHLSPGASATLTVGTLFAWQLRSMHERDEAEELGSGDVDLGAILTTPSAG